MPHLRDQLLVTFAQGGLLVCAHQATTLQEELGEWGAGLGVKARKEKKWKEHGVIEEELEIMKMILHWKRME